MMPKLLVKDLKMDKCNFGTASETNFLLIVCHSMI